MGVAQMENALGSDPRDSGSYPLSRATYEEDIEFRNALVKAFRHAIDTIGLDNFKKCSMFGSNKL
jgi:hypothetical protein